MIDSKRLLLGASAAVLGPVLGLALTPAQAQSEETGAGSSAPAQAQQQTAPPAAPAAAPSPEQARADMEQRMNAAMTERTKRYEELRKRAAEVGLELPETPPWAAAGMPQPPAMPADIAQPGAGAATERKPMTREELEAMRQQRWEAMRERAKEMGRELPETPPWEAAEQRRKELLKKYEEYRATIEAMTDEQKEAIAALFGGRAAEAPAMPQRPMGGRMGGPCAHPQSGQPCGRGMMPGYGGPGPRMGPAMGPGMMPMMMPGGQAPSGSQSAPAG
ncbi:hypothetical protein, partial [Thiohalocapsa halophila]